MNILLKIEILVGSFFIIALIIHMLKIKNMTIKYSILWLSIPLVFIFFTIFSDPMIKFANKLGFELLSNMIFMMALGMLFAISFSLTVIVSKLNKRVVKLTQEISLLKADREEK